MDINEFKAKIGGSLASPSRFRVLITGCVLDSSGAKALAVLCNQAQFPGRNIATNEYTTHGPIRKQPYSSIYDDIVLSLYCQENMGVNKLFYEWQSFIQDNSTSNEFSYFDDYVSDVIIEQLNPQGSVEYAVKLIDAYPIMVAPLQLDWAQQNSFHNLQVTMAFRYWRDEPMSAGPFGNFLKVSNLFPNLNVAGALEKTGAAIFSRVSGSLISSISQNIRFSRNVDRSRSGGESLSGSQQGDSAGNPGDNNLINDGRR